ncbi:hypothetical protein [Hyphomicrobium sp.]|uniref:hypothetical protein n=1 Tax=Hyphomicrobium sp. TaxID=82 RepID=UPI002D7A1913|nr:hypothetical protein [Hyphomicrobium sp.]HET6391050.1 hypothetical protein [Hyphomicrobium sp.]
MKHRFVLSILAAAVATVCAHRAEAATTVSIAGQSMSCGSTRVFSDNRLPMEGRFVPGRGIIINHGLMNQLPPAVRKFVFKHECAHKTVGGNELAADCIAAQEGAREKWLTSEGVDTVCKALENEPASPGYPSGIARCANIKKCYANPSTRSVQKSGSQRPAGSRAPRPAY